MLELGIILGNILNTAVLVLGIYFTYKGKSENLNPFYVYGFWFFCLYFATHIIELVIFNLPGDVLVRVLPGNFWLLFVYGMRSLKIVAFAVLLIGFTKEVSKEDLISQNS